MIIIFSTQEDMSTQVVVEWLRYFKLNFIVINELNPITDITINLDREEDSTNKLRFSVKSGEVICDDEINVVWYRRGLYFFEFPYLKLKAHSKFASIYEHLSDEYKSLISFLFKYLDSRTIGEFGISLPNKIDMLVEAKKAGLMIPNSNICCRAQNSLKGKHINKNISDVMNFRNDEYWFYNRTTVQKKYATQEFFPSFFQECIEKKHELRIFYFLGSLYTMMTSPINADYLVTDVRDITQTREFVRNPVRLPEALESKLLNLIEYSGYTTCSIDMMIDDFDNYYFLEINPIGQFNHLSVVCNYNVEFEIATKLKQYEKIRFNKRVE